MASLSNGAPQSNGHVRPRPSLGEFAFARSSRFRASYDAARDSDEFKYYWANSDSYDSDSANSQAVRSKLVSRSRYEAGNNGYFDGIVQTYATDVVGLGPQLRMQTGSIGFNQMVESQWRRWAKVIKLRRKLWSLCHAKMQDGEGFAMLHNNPRMRSAIKLDVLPFETEMCRTPFANYFDGNSVDGIDFDEFGNPEFYHVLKSHPGGSANLSGGFGESQRIPAKFIVHWFLLRRPGQHRAVPESTSTLNVGAAARRWREATLAAAETAADIAALLTSNQSPNDEADEVAAMSTLEFQKRMLTALPMGWDARQMEGKHPNATFEAFHKQLVNEMARPKSMPYNKAACDSSQYNYASGRLDHQTYYGALDVDRADADDLVLEPIFESWIEEAILEFGWLGGDPRQVDPMNLNHAWDWPKHRVADIRAEASANDITLKNGSRSLSRQYSDCGEDFQDEIEKMAADFGIDVDTMRQRLLDSLYPTSAIVADVSEDEDEDKDEDKSQTQNDDDN